MHADNPASLLHAAVLLLSPLFKNDVKSAPIKLNTSGAFFGCRLADSGKSSGTLQHIEDLAR
jgi:hypothetical protein